MYGFVSAASGFILGTSSVGGLVADVNVDGTIVVACDIVVGGRVEEKDVLWEPVDS